MRALLPGTLPVAAAVLVAAGAATLSPSPARGTPAATFAPPMILAGGGAEPSIRVPEDGRSAAYVSAPSGLGSNFWRITEKTNPDGTKSFVQSPVQQPDLGTGGGDSEISVGNGPVNEGCDQIAYTGLHNIDLLDNFTAATSTDCGATFTLANPYATQNTLTDRQWQAFDGKKTNFLIYHKVDTSQIVVSQSLDGGQTYVSLAPDGAHGVIDATTMPSVANTNQVGNIVTDYSQATGATYPVSGDPVHVLYAVFGGPRDPQDNAQAQIDGNAQGAGAYNHVDTIYLGKSTDGGLTWTDTKVYGVDPASHRELNLLFPVVDVDKAGNVYVAWSDGFKVEYAVSTDHGTTFSKPYQVNHGNRGLDPVTGAEKPDPGAADLFPWIAAGADGLLDVVWYHGFGGAPTSNLNYRDPGDANTKWTVAFAQLGDADRSVGGVTVPTELTYSEAVTPPVHKGDICQNGTFCSLVPVPGAPFSTGDRSLLDFFEVAIDGEGRANIALADNIDAPGAYISAYTRQTSGYSLTTGELLPPQNLVPPKLVCTPDAAFTDPSGDADEVVVGTPLPSAPALDITGGSVSFDAAAKKLVLHVKVLDLSQDPPAGGTGEQFEFGFAYAGTGYFGVASHDATQPADEFHMESPLRTSVGGALTGVFDKAKSEVRIEIPADFFSKIGKGPVVAKGARFSGLAITSRRDVASALVPNADAAGSLGCTFVVGGASVPGNGGTGTGGLPPGTPPTVPAPVVKRPVPATPTMPATGAADGLPLVATGLALGALAVLRRRRTA
ncbi:MAG TPA: hypothetical protein VFQ85_16430 [Mycobacteriales bacterium]|jgi:hypothetical protein|nr:hypothetical protein [Mycobacteriales bacterium]